MRRVGIVTFDFYPIIGGQGRHTFELWRRLSEDGELDLHVFSPSTNSLPGHHRVFPQTLRFGRHLLLSVLARAALRRWQRRYALDIVHVNGGPGGLLLLGGLGRGGIYTVHHTYFQQSRLVPGQAWKRLFVPLEKRAYSSASHVTADSPSTAEALVAMGLQTKPTVVPSGVDLGVFRLLGLERLPGSVLFVGRLDGRKGIMLLARAFPHLLAAVPDARLYVIGNGPLRSAVEAFLDGKGGERVTFLGRVPEEELVRWYNRAEVVVVPSAFEGFGLSVIEAQACGAVVVGTDRDGIRDLIGDGETGRLVPCGDERALAAAVASVLRDGERAAAIRRRSLDQARLYDWNLVAQRWRDIYRSVT